MGEGTRGSRAPVSPDATRGPARVIAAIIGAVFLLVGVLGFIPGVTTGYDELQLFGHESEAYLFGIFQVSVLHNVVHLLFGFAGLIAAASAPAARWYLIIGGLIYLVLWLYGLFVGHDSAANFVPLNAADNWLHLGLAIGMIALGMLVRPSRGVRP